MGCISGFTLTSRTADIEENGQQREHIKKQVVNKEGGQPRGWTTKKVDYKEGGKQKGWTTKRANNNEGGLLYDLKIEILLKKGG